MWKPYSAFCIVSEYQLEVERDQLLEDHYRFHRNPLQNPCVYAVVAVWSLHTESLAYGSHRYICDVPKYNIDMIFLYINVFSD